MDVQQGNLVTQEMVSQLQPGMDRQKVRYIMGTPLIVDVFHQDRWDYYYSFRPGGGELEQRRVTLFFDSDRLARIEGDVVPAAQEGAAAEQRTVSVPLQQPEQEGFFGGLKRRLGFGTKEPEPSAETAQSGEEPAEDASGSGASPAGTGP
jgi:outer membrane protein assembly factor BamE